MPEAGGRGEGLGGGVTVSGHVSESGGHVQGHELLSQHYRQ